MERTRKHTTSLFTLFFILSFSMLLYLEGFFDSGTHKIKNLSFFIPPNLLLDDSWYGVYSKDTYIGHSHSFMRAQESDKGGGYLLKNTTMLNIPILGHIKRLNMQTTLLLSKNHSLQHAVVTMKSSGYFFEATLKRKKENYFDLSISTPTQKIKKEIKLSNQLINSSFAPIFINYLPPKKKISFSFFDPIVNKTTTIHIKNKGPTSLEINGKIHNAVKFSFDVEGIKGEIYTDTKGQLLKQSFLGFELIKEETIDLFSKDTANASNDLINRFTIPSVYLAGKENLKYLKAKITGIDRESIINDFNQKVTTGTSVIEIIKKEPTVIVDIPVERTGFAGYLAEDNFIKFHSNQVEETALKIVMDEKNSFVIIKLLSQWIDKNIKKIPTISIPNSLDVLHLKQGDCTELSALMVGFLRSLGIPSYINIGIVYQNGRFFYHAWVSAFIGEWIDTDPALEQLIADATHIKLKKGLRGQFEIFKFIDRLGIEIIEYE